MLSIPAIKKQQNLLFMGIIGVLLTVIGVLGVLLFSDAAPQEKRGGGVRKNPLTTGTSRLKPQEVWVHKMTAEAEVSNKRIEALEDSLTKMIKLMQDGLVPQEASAQEKPSLALSSQPLGSTPSPTPQPQLLSAVEVTAKDAPPSNGNEFPPLPPPNPDARTFAPAVQSHRSTSRTSLGAVQKITLSLRNPKKSGSLKTVDNTIPAGAFAKAVLLGGVDASTSTQASSDPRPVLLKITDLGTLPRRFRSDLKGCHALGASYGDISSERVFMRLEKLTCVERQTGEIVELTIQGYVAGEDGRAGVRGIVVDRTGESMRNALLGGFVSGMGQYLSQANNPITFSPVNGLAQTNPFSVAQAAQHAAAKGASSALDKYADFYIKRAEQMQPVLQISAGREVDIVFTQGVAMDGSSFRNTIATINDQKRNQTIASLQMSDDSQQPTE